MTHKTVHDIKRSQKESTLYRIIAQMFLEIAQENPELQGLTVNRVKLSADKGACIVLFYSVYGKSYFEEKLPSLVLYKPSMRSAIAKTVPSRYTPELVFRYDDEFAKQTEVEQLLDRLKVEEPS
jgi:ribosome-binding factor A